MVIAQVGRLVASDDAWMPYRLVDDYGVSVPAVSAWFAERLASGRAETTLRSYGLDLLRWFRFCWAVGLTWDAATRADAKGLLALAPGSRQAAQAPLAPS